MKKNNFAANILQRNDIAIVYLKGYLDAHSAPQLEDEINELIKNNQNNIIFEFSNLEYISSAGLGVFMTFIEQIRDLGGDLKLSNMTEKVQTVFDLLGFNILFEIYNTLDEAVNKFNSTKI